MVANRFRVVSGALLAASATATVLLTAACSGTATVASDGSTTSVHWSTVQGAATAPASATQTGGAAPAAPAAQQKLLFPNTSFTASVDSYDATTHMVSFQVVVFQPGGPDDGTFNPDPNRPGTYRLPVTDSAQITGRLSLCPGIDQYMSVGVSCDTPDFEKQLSAGRSAYADIHVDSADRIDAVSERYHP